MTIGTRLKAARHNAGLTQQELADLACVDRRTISRLEAAGETSNSPMLDRIANKLKVSPAYIRYGDKGLANYDPHPAIRMEMAV